MIDNNILKDTKKRFRKMNIYDQIGLSGLVDVVWKSAPKGMTGLLGLFTLPYGITAYYEMLKKSSNLDELLIRHYNKYNESLFFKRFRPRYHRAEKILREKYGVK